MLPRLALALALVALALPASADARRTNRIVGGVPAGIETMPYTAGIQIALQGVGGTSRTRSAAAR